MKLYKDPISGVYHVTFVGPKGTMIRSTKCKAREAALVVCKGARIEELELASMAKALNATSIQAIMAGRRVTCETAGEEFAAWRETQGKSNSIYNQLVVLRQFFRELDASKWPVTKLDEKHVNGFVNKPDGTGARNRALRLSAIHSFFEFCKAKAYCIGDPSQLAKVRYDKLSHSQKETKERVPFTEHEFNHMLKHTTGFWRTAIALSYWAGFRLGDVAGLEYASLDLDHVVVWTLKSDKRVSIPVNDPLVGGGQLSFIIMGLLENQGDGLYVFPEERDTILDHNKRSKLSVQFGRLLTSLGIEGKSFHCLRHSFATRLLKAGKPIEEIGTLLGHSNTKTTEIYAHIR